MERTPTPWVMRQPTSGAKVTITAFDNRRICSVDYSTTMRNPEQLLDINKSNAAFIIRACNGHVKLVHTLKAARELLGAAGLPDAVKNINAVLAEVEGR